MEAAWIHALLGGALIGIAVSLFLYLNGRVTGISGIFYGILSLQRGDMAWRIFFVLGLLAGGFIFALYQPQVFGSPVEPSSRLFVAGLIVGFGTILGSGCTSGHGVCGVSRLAPRSLISTGIFMASGILAVAFFRSMGVL